MHNIKCYRLLALGMLAVPFAGRAQTTPAQGPQPKITEIATIPRVRVSDARKMPNGRVVIYVVGDSILTYDRTTKRSMVIARGFDLYLSMSARGDRIAYFRRSEDWKSSMPWTIALDPETGAPTGAAQRVSTRGGDSPGLSPDGKLLTYFADLGTSAQGQDLVVMSATGGTERILAHYDLSTSVKGINAPTWSADGKWIYVSVTGDSATSLERIPATGGNRERVFSHPDPKGSSYSSIDGQVSLFGGPVQSGRIGYVTANGVRGEFATPPGESWNRYSLGSPGAVVAVHAVPAHLHVLNLEDGKVVDLPFDGTNAANAAWSADKKRLALGAGDDQKREIVVMNADGSGQRRYPVTGARPIPSWSPDGSTLVYSADSGQEIRVLNLTTGASRVIASAPAGSYLSNIVWLPDGKAFRTIAGNRPKDAAPGQLIRAFSVLEIRLDGRRRVVRDLATEFPTVKQAFLPSILQAVLEFGDSTAAGATQFLLVPLDGSAARPVSVPTLDAGMRPGWVTGYSEKWFSVMLFSKDSKVNNRPVGVELISTGTDTTRVNHFPSNVYFPGLNLVLPDGHVAMIGRATGDKDFTVYAIPLDGTAPRAIGHVPTPLSGMSGWGHGLSPDSKLFAFFSPGTPTTHLYDIDLTPILQLINKKP